MREKPVVQYYEDVLVSREPIRYGSASEVARALNLTPGRISQLLKSNLPIKDGSRLFFLSDWQARHGLLQEPELQPDADEPTITASEVTLKEIPQPKACPLRIINYTVTGTEWLCGRVESGKFFCQELDYEQCKIYQHIEEQKRRAY